MDPTAGLEVYLVGGAVRDRLLGRPVRDRDWVVVGATVDQMLKLGFKRVGHDFPVFLHPDSGEQYALARQERKSAPGYHGFVTQSDPDVTLEEDLLRRDLTINALAETPNGEVIDPYGGLQDIERRQLRHVSPAFNEDPLRVLRVARFAAQLQPLSFEVAAPTLELMRGMVDNGEVDTLVVERVQQELAGALAGARTTRFLQVLRDCGALARVLPEVDALFEDKAARAELCRALDRAFELEAASEVCFAVLTYDFAARSGSGTPDEAARRVEALCERLRAPRGWRKLALAVTRQYSCYMALADLSAGQILELIEHLNGFREPALLAAFCQVCAALSDDGPEAAARSTRLQAALAAARRVDAGATASDIRRGDPVDPKRLNQRIQEAVGDARREAIRQALAAEPPNE